MYVLSFDIKADKELSKLQENMRDRIFTKILETKKNPFLYFEKLQKHGWKLRIGDYRVIADITGNTVLVRRIGHRKNIYKKL